MLSAPGREEYPAWKEQYIALREQYSRGVDGFVLMYDVRDPQSFRDIKTFGEQILMTKNPYHFPMVVVANYCSKVEERQVTVELGRNLAKALPSHDSDSGCPFIEVCTETGLNLSAPVHDLIREIRLFGGGIPSRSFRRRESPLT